MSESEKKIDNLGRIVLPASFRKSLGIKPYDKLFIRLRNSEIIITPTRIHCALCGAELLRYEKIRLCSSCIAKVKAVK